MPPSENSLNEAMDDDRRQPAKQYWYIRRVSNKSKIFALEDTDLSKIEPFREFSAYTVFTAGCRNRISRSHSTTAVQYNAGAQLQIFPCPMTSKIVSGFKQLNGDLVFKNH